MIRFEGLLDTLNFATDSIARWNVCRDLGYSFESNHLIHYQMKQHSTVLLKGACRICENQPNLVEPKSVIKKNHIIIVEFQVEIDLTAYIIAVRALFQFSQLVLSGVVVIMFNSNTLNKPID